MDRIAVADGSSDPDCECDKSRTGRANTRLPSTLTFSKWCIVIMSPGIWTVARICCNDTGCNTELAVSFVYDAMTATR